MTMPRLQKGLGAPRGLGDCSHKRGIDGGVVDRIPLRRHDTRLKDTHRAEVASNTIIEVGSGFRPRRAGKVDLRT